MKLLRVILFSLCTIQALSQQKFYIQKRQGSRLKSLKSEKLYQIKTTNETFDRKEIVGFTDSTLKITIDVKTPNSVMRYISCTKPGDTDIEYIPIYRVDTLEIPYRDIIYINKPWFNNRQWLEPFGYFAVAGVMGIALIPVAAVDDGAQGAKEGAAFVGSILGVSLSAIFVGTRERTFDMQTKWAFTGKKTRRKS